MTQVNTKQSKLIAAVIAVLAIIWMASGQFGSSEQPSEDTVQENAAASKSLDTVQTVEVQTLSAQDHPRMITVNGRTEAFRTSRISAEISGQIGEILAENGALLQQGDPIASINVDDRAAAVRSAQNRVKQFEIEYKTAQNLLERGFSTNVQVATKRAELESAKATLRRAEIDLENTKVRAPFDGVLERRMVEDGDYVQIGQEIALYLDLDPIKVVGFVAEQRIDNVKIGQDAQIATPNGNSYTGQVYFISRTADESTRTFRVEVTVDNPDLEIADGLTSEMQLEGGNQVAHKISPAVLTLGPEGDVGVKYVEDNTVQFMPVNITTSDPDAIWVTGLPDPVQLIVVGQDFVTPGQQVETKERTDSASAEMDAEMDMSPPDAMQGQEPISYEDNIVENDAAEDSTNPDNNSGDMP